jgi:hypothetical protein
MRRVGVQLTLLTLVLGACATAPRPLAVIPIRPDGHLMVLPVEIAGRQEWFTWDSGAPHLIIDPRLAKAIALSERQAGNVTGTGKGPVGIIHAAPVEIAIGGVRFTADDPWIIDLAGVPIPADIRGLIGADLLNRYVVQMNSQNHTLSLFAAGTYRPGRHETALPLIAKDGKFYIDVALTVKPGLTVTHRLRIDTGSEESVNDPIMGEAPETRRTKLGGGLGADYEAVSGKIPAISVGPYVIANVWGPGGSGPAIGMEVFRRFVTTFDVAAGKLYLKPTPALTEPVPPPPDHVES